MKVKSKAEVVILADSLISKFLKGLTYSALGLVIGMEMIRQVPRLECIDYLIYRQVVVFLMRKF